MPTFPNGALLGTVRQYLNDTGLRKNNFAPGRAPVAGDDSTQGYEPGSIWLWGSSQWIYTGSAWVASVGSTAWVDITGKPATFAPSAHRHDASEIDNLPSGGSTAWDDITGKPAAFPTTWTTVTGKPTTFAPSAHTHVWTDITNPPATYAPTAHQHPINNIIDLQTTLDGKAPLSHTHLWANITNPPATYAPTAHGHPIANIVGLQAELDGKAAASHTHTWANITNPPATYAPTAHNHPISNVVGLQAALDDKLPAREQRVVLAADATVTGITFANAGLSFTIEANSAYHVFLLGRVASDTLTSGGAVILVGPGDCTENGIAWIPNTNGSNGNFNQQRFALGAGVPTPSTGVGTINNSYPIMGHWLVLGGATAGTVQLQMQAEEAGATFRLYANSWIIARKLEAT